MLAISRTVACSRYIYNGVILHAHPVRGESHNQRNTTGEVATPLPTFSDFLQLSVCLGYITEITTPVCEIDATTLVSVVQYIMMRFSPQEHHEDYFT